MVLFLTHRLHCAISHTCQEGQEVKRPQKLFPQKKSNEPLDTFDSVIYVTRVITVNLAVFVSASACNPSFGQATPTNFIGEKAMANQNATTIATNLVVDENGNVNCVNCINCENCENCENCTGCKICYNCTNCTDCTNCTGCEDCDGCEGCVECSYSTRCYNCDTCENCGNSQWCCGCYNVFDDENCNDEDRSCECDDEDEDEECAE